jgi:hypothetical protein
MKPNLFLVALLGITPFASLPGRAATATLFSVADTSLFQPSPDNNLGGLDYLTAGVTAGDARTRALVRFDVAGGVPPGSTITSATLTFNVIVAHGFEQTFELHRMRVGWTEGTGAAFSGMGNVGSPANPGEPTWNSRAHGSSPWGVAGGESAVDFIAAASASATMAATTLTFASAGTTADAQLWLDSPGTNFGWLIRLGGDEDIPTTASRLGSREAAVKPTLVLQYTPPAPPTPPNIFAAVKLGAQFRFSFAGQAGRAYTVESRSPLGAGWNTVTNISTLPADATLHITNVISGNEKYFRVRTP